MMVLGMAALGWFFVQPHAETTVAEAGNGDYVITASPGMGYGYRWYPDATDAKDAKGAPWGATFSANDNVKLHLDEGVTKTIKVEVKNSFSSALDMPVVKWIFPPSAVKEVTISRPKIEKPVKLELGER